MTSLKDKAAAFLTALSAGDFATVRSLAADNIVYTAPPSARQNGFPVPAVGIDQLVDAVQGAFDNYYAELVPSFEALLEDGDWVAALCQQYGRTHSGIPYENRYAFFLRFRNGKIVELNEATDTMHAMQQLAPATAG